MLLLFVLAAPVAAQNLLTNPGFEYWLDTIGVNLPIGWISSEITHPGSANRSTEANSGDYCVELVSPDTAAFLTTTTLVRPGAACNFTGHVRTSATLGGSFLLSWLGLLGGPLGTPTVIPVYRSTDYREYRRRVTAPDSAFFCVVTFASAPGATVYVDDVTLDTLQTGIRGGNPQVTRRFQLYPAQPNPFHDLTVISYSLSVASVVTLRIYDLVGNEVRTLTDDYRPAGFYTAFWNGTDSSGDSLMPGVYFCRLEVGDRTLTQKLILAGE